MTTFTTPGPTSVDVDVIGEVRVTASDRSDTVVTVRPANPAQPSDVAAAEQTTIERIGDRIIVKSKPWRRWVTWGATHAVEVAIEVPTGSSANVRSAAGNLTADGELGACRLHTSLGNLRIDTAHDVVAITALGDISVDRVHGDVEATTSSGEVRVGRVDGEATIKNSNGHTRIDAIGRDARLTSAHGDVRVGEVASGTISLQTGFGAIEVGVAPGVAAWLDVSSGFGSVHSDLDAGGEPTAGEGTVTVRARAGYGDILVRRAVPA